MWTGHIVAWVEETERYLVNVMLGGDLSKKAIKPVNLQVLDERTHARTNAHTHIARKSIRAREHLAWIGGSKESVIAAPPWPVAPAVSPASDDAPFDEGGLRPPPREPPPCFGFAREGARRRV